MKIQDLRRPKKSLKEDLEDFGIDIDDFDDITTVEIFELLKKVMPDIGFGSRDKRIRAYMIVTHVAQELLREGVDKERVVSALMFLHNNHKPFFKAAGMTAFNAQRIGMGNLEPIGVWFADAIAKKNGLPGFGL